MADGLWNAGQNQEQVPQLRKDAHQPLRVNISANGNKNPGDASSFASLDPSAPLVNSIELGPHFMLSPETADESHTYGLEFVLANAMFPAAERFAIGAAGLTVTVWELIGNSLTQDAAAPVIPVWAAFLPQTGVQFFELYHTFDTNACAIRFQIQGSTDDATGGSVMIFMREL